MSSLFNAPWYQNSFSFTWLKLTPSPLFWFGFKHIATFSLALCTFSPESLVVHWISVKPTYGIVAFLCITVTETQPTEEGGGCITNFIFLRREAADKNNLFTPKGEEPLLYPIVTGWKVARPQHLKNLMTSRRVYFPPPPSPSPWISVIAVKQSINLAWIWPTSFFLTHFNWPFSREITNSLYFSPMGVIVGNQGIGRAFCLSVHSVCAPLLLHPESTSHNTEEWQTTDSIKSTDFHRNWIYFLWHVLFATLHQQWW